MLRIRKSFVIPDFKRLLLKYANKSFVLGGVGFSGSVDDLQLCIGSIARLDGAEQEFLSVCSLPVKAMNLYGLLGLKLVNSPHFSVQYDILKSDKSKIDTWSGCCGYSTTVGNLAQEIFKSDVSWLLAEDLNEKDQ